MENSNPPVLPAGYGDEHAGIDGVGRDGLDVIGTEEPTGQAYDDYLSVAVGVANRILVVRRDRERDRIVYVADAVDQRELLIVGVGIKVEAP